MSTRALKLLAYVLLLLAALWAVQRSPSEAPGGAEVLLPEEADVSRLSIGGSAETVELVKKEGAWRLVSPFRAAASRPAVEALLRALSSARVAERIPYDAARGALYFPKGPGASRLEIGLGAQTPPLAFALGRRGARPDSVFLRPESGGEILLVEGLPREAADRPASEFADRVVCSVDESLLLSVDLDGRLPAASYRKEGGTWRSSDGGDSDAFLESFLTALARLEADQVGSPEKLLHPLALKGLDAPLRRIRLASEDTSAPPDYRRELTLEIGPLMPGFRYPLRVSDKPGLVYAAAEWKIKPLLAATEPRPRPR